MSTTTTTCDMATAELIELADMYVSKCTRQEEKFMDFQRRGCAWRWEDCEAAYDLLRERADGWNLWDAWRRGTLEVTP